MTFEQIFSTPRGKLTKVMMTSFILLCSVINSFPVQSNLRTPATYNYTGKTIIERVLSIKRAAVCLRVKTNDVLKINTIQLFCSNLTTKRK